MKTTSVLLLMIKYVYGLRGPTDRVSPPRVPGCVLQNPKGVTTDAWKTVNPGVMKIWLATDCFLLHYPSIHKAIKQKDGSFDTIFCDYIISESGFSPDREPYKTCELLVKTVHEAKDKNSDRYQGFLGFGRRFIDFVCGAPARCDSGDRETQGPANKQQTKTMDGHEKDSWKEKKDDPQAAGDSGRGTQWDTVTDVAQNGSSATKVRAHEL